MLTMHPFYDQPTPFGDAGPSIEEGLSPILERLTCLDDHQRRDAVMRVMAMAVPPIRVLIIDHLVSLLKSRSAAKRRSAEASLCEMKEWGLPWLRSAILSMRHSIVQVRLAAILGRIGRTVSPALQWDIHLALGITMARTKDAKVVAAVLLAMEQIRPGSAAVEVALRSVADGAAG